MSMRPHPKYASSDIHAGAWATCDACGFVWNHPKLEYNREWAGFVIVNKRTLVCPRCLDVPNEQLRSLVLPPDPDPVLNARPEQYSVDEDFMPLVTEPAYPGDPGQVIRDPNTKKYIRVDPGPPGAATGGTFTLDSSTLDGSDVLD